MITDIREKDLVLLSHIIQLLLIASITNLLTMLKSKLRTARFNFISENKKQQ